ncbi:MAG: SDR family oxidoreductase [Rhodospirillaceae bacterium]|nr:SDR family oxidoreductase [Rhodospirillaceae bacterium]
MTTLTGQVALVTGAGSPDGIGFAIAQALAAAGARVAITSTTNRIKSRLKDMGGADQHLALIADLTDAEAVAQLVKGVNTGLGRIDILVNNAGMIQTGKRERARLFHEIAVEDWLRTMDINLNTCFHVSRAVLPQMLRRKYGRIVNIASVTGPLVTNPRSAGYSAAKAAMVGLTRALAIEVADKGITVNAVAPGWIQTGSSAKSEIVAGNHTPAKRPGRPDEVAAVAAFLASRDASYVTGQMLVVDGGNSIQEYKGPSGKGRMY